MRDTAQKAHQKAMVKAAEKAFNKLPRLVKRRAKENCDSLLFELSNSDVAGELLTLINTSHMFQGFTVYATSLYDVRISWERA